MFKEISFEDAGFNVFTTVRKDWLILTAGNDETGYNPMTCSWGHFGHVWGKFSSWIYVRPDRYTRKFMDENDVYTLCVFNDSYRESLNYAGTASGRDEDKVEKTGWTPVRENGAQYYEEADLVFICRKIYQTAITEEGFTDHDLWEKMYGKAPMHRGYVGEITKILIREQ